MPTGPRAPLSCCQVRGPSGCALEVGLSGPGQGPTGEGHAVLVAGGAEGDSTKQKARHLGLGAAGFKDRDRKGLQARGLGRELEAGGGTRAGGRHSETSDHSSLPPSCR